MKRARTPIVALVAGLLLGCSGTAWGSVPPNTVPTGSLPPGSVAMGVAAARTAPVDWCAATQIEVALQPSEGGSGMGKTDTTLRFVNRGSAPCRLRGFVEIREIGRDDAPLGRPAVHDGDLGTVVTLAPHGGAALAPTVTTNPGMFDEKTCQTVTGKGLRIVLPGPDGRPGDPARDTLFLPIRSMLSCSHDVGEPRLRTKSLTPA